MYERKCPLCGSKRFYVKDPEDEYESYEFELRAMGAVFDETTGAQAPELDSSTSTFCTRCSWHGRFGELENTRKSP